MRGPRRNTEREMLEKLRYGGVVDGDGLTTAEHRLIDGSAELSRELSLNQVLDASGFSGPMAPPVADRLNAAIARSETETAWEDQGKMRSLLVGKKWYWQAAIIAAVVVLVVVATAVWPWRVDVTPWGGIGVGNQAAWATVDGFILDYKLKFEEAYQGTAEDSPDHPLWQVQILLDEWLTTHEQVVVAGSPALAELRFDTFRMDVEPGFYSGEKGFIAEFQVLVYSDDRGLVDGLIDELKQVPGLEEPEVYSQQWYYSEKYPDTRYQGCEVVINGRTLSYPRDIREEDLSLLRYMLIIWPTERGRMICALDDSEEFRRFGLGDFIQVTWDDEGAINIENLPQKLDFSSLGLPGWVHRVSLYIPSSEVNSDFDLVDLARKYAKKYTNPYSGQVLTGSFRVVANLVPLSTWHGATAEELAAGVTNGRLRKARRLADDYQAALEDVLERLPQADGCIEAEVISRGDVPIQWTAVVTAYESRALADELAAAMRMRVDNPVQVHNLVTGPRMFNSPIRISSRQTTSVMIPLLEYRDSHGSDEWAMVELATDEQRRWAQEQCQEIRRLVRDWRKQKMNTGELVNPRFNCFVTVDVPVRATVSLDFDHELGEELAAYLREAGFPAAERNNIDMPNLDPAADKVAVGWLFEPVRFTGVNEDDVVHEFTPEEIAWAKEMKATVETVVAEFKQANGIGDFQSGAINELGVWWREYGGLPTGYLIPATFQEDYEYEDLFADLVDVGLPAPRILRPYDADARGPLQEVYRREMGSLDMSPGGERKQNVLMFYLPHSLRLNACSVEALPDTFTMEEKQEARNLLDRMQVALDDWLASAPSDVEASLESVERWGAIQEIAVICNYTDRATVLDLGEALSVEGAPVYQYGAGYLLQTRQWPAENNRELVEVSQTSINWGLISQVRAGSIASDENYRQNLLTEFSPEEREQAESDGRAVLRGYLRWLELHPEMDEPLPGLANINTMKSQYHLSRREDLSWIAQVTFIESDEDKAQALLDDLKACVREAGCGIEPYRNQYARNAVMYVEKD